MLAVYEMTKTLNIETAAEQEAAVLRSAPGRLGPFFELADHSVSLLAGVVASIDDPRHGLFGGWLILARNYAVQALLSELRRHHVQASANLRLMMESAVLGAYSLHLSSQDKDPTHRTFGQKERKKAHDWIADAHAELSLQAKLFKGHVNDLDLHASLTHSIRVVDYDSFGKGVLVTSFCEFEDLYAEKSHVWLCGGAVLVAAEIFIESALRSQGIGVSPRSIPLRDALRADVERLRSVLIREPRFLETIGAL